MKRTNMEVLAMMTSTRAIYRTVYEADGYYYIKWNNKIVNVDTDIVNRNYVTK